ncbi:MAG: FHA domain-containing protein, partial [Planctomycetes bacterium]|nr:FHA domain-containing protein [Planctomycetota bacterium]
MVAFIVESPEGVRRLEFDADEVRIGRADDNEIVLENESRCSRAHARIRRTAAGWALEDLDSANGTRMDGLKIRRVVLERGASFAIGETSITFLGSTDDAAPRPPDAEGSPQDPVVTRPLPEVPRYAALRWLGEGAVFRALAARHEPSGEIEVLRVPRARFSDRADFEPWLEQWLADWSRIEEPGLVRLDRLAAGEGAIILRERLAEAGTLADRLQSEGRQELSAVVELGLAVARPLAALHQAGMAHGGLTASCLRLYAEGSPRLSGPGHPPGFRGLVAEAHMASLHLSAPECFTPQGVSGRRSDVYALGGILHQLALGFAPNEGKSLEAIEKSVMKGLYKPPVERRPEMPAPLSDLIVACLKTEPAERPTSATEIQEAL